MSPQSIEHIPAARMRRPSRTSKATASSRVADAIIDMLGRLPRTSEIAGNTPDARARAIAHAAARKAGMVAATLALPPGPLGWLTVLPELYAIWKIQAQMVADIGGAYGHRRQLTREQMMFCLFRHTAAQALRDIAVQAGERWLVQTASLTALRSAARRVGIKLSQRGIGSGMARWLPLVGAAGVGAYAWYDTREVGRTAIKLFAMESAVDRAQTVG